MSAPSEKSIEPDGATLVPDDNGRESLGEKSTLEDDSTSSRIENVDVESSPQPETTVGPPPDGGLMAWLQIVAGHLVVFNTWGYTISFGIFQPVYEERMNLPPSTVSWVGSIQICLIFLVGTFSGRAFDAGYYRWALLVGAFLHTFGVFMTSISTEYWQLFLAQGLSQGLGNGIVFAPTIANMSTYFSTKRTMALCTAACGGATGGMVFPLIAQQLLPKIGFEWTVRAMGLVVLVAWAIIIALARPRLPPRKSGPLVELAAFKEMTYLLFAISMWFTLWATYFAYYYARTYALDVLGASGSTSFTILLVINVVGIPGRMVPAFLADRYFGAVNVFIPMVIGAALCIFLWAEVEDLVGAYVWVIFFGFFGGGIQGMFPATLAGLTKDLSKTGTRIGMIFTIISIVALTGPPIAGALMEATGGEYLAAQIWGGSCLLLGAGFLIGASIASKREL